MKIAYVTCTQSGTHILGAVFGPQLPVPARDGKSFPGVRFFGEALQTHRGYSEATEAYLRFGPRHLIFQMRDPRDMLVARFHKTGKTWEECIRWTARYTCKQEPWMRHADTIIRYEDLILQTPRTMAALTSLLGKEFVSRIRIGGPSPTFRAGRIGDWKTDFPKEYVELYEELCEPIRYWEWQESS